MRNLLLLPLLFLGACTNHETEPLKPVSQIAIQNVAGMKIYQRDCVACHGNDGMGAFSGVPDLTQIAGFKKGDDSKVALFKHIKHVKNGKKTPGSPISMPAKGGDPHLTDQDIKEVLKYMREKFINQ